MKIRIALFTLVLLFVVSGSATAQDGSVKPSLTVETKGISGTVLSFDADKGYGFIRPDRGGPDIFVHISALEQAGINTLTPNDRVTFDIEFDKRGKSRATNVKMAAE
jgi:CspA family cold shock protein